jgi:hypothetical protein
MENPIPGPVDPVDPPVEEVKPIGGMFAALGLIFSAIARNIASGGIVEMTNMFRTFFRSFLCTVLVIGGGWFLWTAAFMDKAKVHEQTSFIVGFITASVIGVCIGFYFGGQDRSKKPEEGGDK